MIKTLRRTKIVATIGPVSSSKEVLAKLVQEGVNVFRLNFSHGSYESHAEIIKNIRCVSKELGDVVGILQDVQGPKIRIGDVGKDGVFLNEGDTYCLTNKPVVADENIASVTYENLLIDIKEGATILINDGKMELRVEQVESDRLVCKILVGGLLTKSKGINFPDSKLSIGSLTEKDKEDILFGIKERVDMIAVSFVQSAKDVMEAKDLLSKYNSNMPVISKIECQEAIKNLDSIISVSDGVIVARGDLGVELPVEDIPLVQKEIIRKCNEAGVPVVTATQMLDSMENNPKPTRAEITDIANAIFDGTDAVMLSGETAMGKYPIESVRIMAKIAQKADVEVVKKFKRIKDNKIDTSIVSDSICMAAANISKNLNAQALLVTTYSGSSAKQIAKYRTPALVIAATPERATLRQLSIVWGVYPLLVPIANDTDSLIKTVVDESHKQKLIKDGDIVVITGTAGMPLGIAGTTNILKIEVVSTILAKGIGVGNDIVCGKAVLALTPEDAINKVKQGDILITTMTDNDFNPAIEKCAAIITEEGGLTSHVSVISTTSKKPIIIGVSDIFEKVEENQIITIDPRRGLIFAGELKIV